LIIYIRDIRDIREGAISIEIAPSMKH